MGKIAKPVKKSYFIFNGFDFGLKPQKIINMKQSPDGNIYFLVKWKKTKIPSYLITEVAKKMCPLLVCEFYQRHVIFSGNKFVNS